ncbi:MAG: 2Fe-2S iron-sulfur cluster-binding protein [Pseudomonadota bacterium]
MTPDRPGTPDTVWSVTLQPQGRRFASPAAGTVLAAAEAAGLRLPSSCRNGTCRTCLCRMVSGVVTYRIAWPGLSAEEKLAGYMLPCVAHAAADLVLEARAAPSAAA